MLEYTIILFYRYVRIENPDQLRRSQIDLATRLNITGRIIVSKEGINATLEGTNENVEIYLKELLTDERFKKTHIKKSAGIGNAFPKLSVKVRKEIVTLGLSEDIDPNIISGKRLKPENLKQWYESGKEFYVIDMRNDYEFNVGRFKDSALLPLENFRDVPKTLSRIENLKEKTVLSVCTGGVRCEKASGLLMREGFKDVYQLDGGIVSYIEKFPLQEFEGSLYVFDRRVIINNDSNDKHVVIGKCDKCGTSSERYVNCKNPECNKHFLCCADCSLPDGKSYCSESCLK